MNCQSLSSTSVDQLCSTLDIQHYIQHTWRLSDTLFNIRQQDTDKHMMNVLSNLTPLACMPVTLLPLIGEYSKCVHDDRLVTFVHIESMERPQPFPPEKNTMDFVHLSRLIQKWVKYFNGKIIIGKTTERLWNCIVQENQDKHKVINYSQLVQLRRESFSRLHRDQLDLLSSMVQREKQIYDMATLMYVHPVINSQSLSTNEEFEVVADRWKCLSDDDKQFDEHYQRLLTWWKTMDEARNEAIEWRHSWSNPKNI